MRAFSGMMIFYLGCDKIIGGIGLNLFASGLTLLLMTVWFNEDVYKRQNLSCAILSSEKQLKPFN